MGAKRRINTDHPDCDEYTKKFKAIWQEYYEREEAEKLKAPLWEGRDNPSNEALLPIYKKCCEETKRLQSQYEYLFQEEGADNAR